MGEWQQGLFGCFNNLGICIISYFIPCYQNGKNAEAVGESCILHGVLTLLACIGIWSIATIRGKIRDTKGIEGGFGGDCIATLFCPVCVIAQSAQEMGQPGLQTMARE